MFRVITLQSTRNLGFLFKVQKTIQMRSLVRSALSIVRFLVGSLYAIGKVDIARHMRACVVPFVLQKTIHVRKGGCGEP